MYGPSKLGVGRIFSIAEKEKREEVKNYLKWIIFLKRWSIEFTMEGHTIIYLGWVDTHNTFMRSRDFFLYSWTVYGDEHPIDFSLSWVSMSILSHSCRCKFKSILMACKNRKEHCNVESKENTRALPESFWDVYMMKRRWMFHINLWTIPTNKSLLTKPLFYTEKIIWTE